MILLTHLTEIKNAWKTALTDKVFRVKFILSVAMLALALFFLAKFLPYSETRPGFSLNDPLLSAFKPVDLTWITFVLIYGALLVGLVSIAKYPRRILIAFQSYTLVASLRLITIYFLPFNAPPDIIPMEDPFVAFFGGGKTLLRDLFFSGHTATMLLLALVAKNKILKTILVICTVLVAVAVLAQHVHYTIDVIVAPFFAYTGYRIARLINKKKNAKVEKVV